MLSSIAVCEHHSNTSYTRSTSTEERRCPATAPTPDRPGRHGPDSDATCCGSSAVRLSRAVQHVGPLALTRRRGSPPCQPETRRRQRRSAWTRSLAVTTHTSSARTTTPPTARSTTNRDHRDAHRKYTDGEQERACGETHRDARSQTVIRPTQATPRAAVDRGVHHAADARPEPESRRPAATAHRRRPLCGIATAAVHRGDGVAALTTAGGEGHPQQIASRSPVRGFAPLVQRLLSV